MDTLQALQNFIRVVELGSFTAAAHEADVTQPTMSKIISKLEHELGVRLIKRSTTALVLTDEGRRLYDRTKGLLEEYTDTVAEVRGQTTQAVGKLVVAAPVGLGELRLNSLAIEFLTDYPEIELELVLSDRIVDLVEEGVDLAIRLSADLPPNVIARKLASSPRLLVAHSSYLETAPPLDDPEALSRHSYIRFGGIASLSQLEFVSGDKIVVVTPVGRYRINSSLALKQCFLAGVGLGTAPAWLVQDLIDDGSLVHLLPEWTLDSQPLYLVYPSRRYLPQRAMALIQFLCRRLPELPGFNAVNK
ncbi:LysR family transcriptional regulator [Acidihalobacter yilgarnensis]|uniref:LysR family transcriptional regulator n=1 Tax=Acidihalobacter yilgarnensis TaxID=2819280 RepID=A0A1D8ITF3_9GAMM|nr:LysR family transcriptional regulator [Acidihalobacter yilgarnensis]AOU99802.1 LysR family transcriptional regulator [Acidihalobacter yilgarnensis]